MIGTIHGQPRPPIFGGPGTEHLSEYSGVLCLPPGLCTTTSAPPLTSDVLAWLGLEANGFGLALGGFGFQDLQARPRGLALAWLWLGLARAMA